MPLTVDLAFDHMNFSFLTQGNFQILNEHQTDNYLYLYSLQAIVRNEDTQLIMHPVIQRLLSKKRTQFGLKAFLIELLLNIVFTCIWTALTVTLPIPLQYKTRINFYYPLKENIWRIVLEGIGTLLVMVFIVKVCLHFKYLR